MSWRLILGMFIVITLSACERVSTPYAGVGEPDDAPPYNIELDYQKSPADSADN